MTNNILKYTYLFLLLFSLIGCNSKCKVKITKDYIYCKEWGEKYTPFIVIKEIKTLNPTANFSMDDDGLVKKNLNSEIDTSFIYRTYWKDYTSDCKEDTVFFTKKMKTISWYKNWKEYEVDRLYLKEEIWYYLDITNYHEDVYFYIEKNGNVIVSEYNNDNW